MIGSGVMSKGIYTGIIKPGMDIKNIGIRNALADPAVGGAFKPNDILAFTEAVVAYWQQNFCTYEAVGSDVEAKYGSATELVLFGPITSRNRFVPILKGVLSAPSLKKIHLVMTYLSDEVGNSFFDEMPDDVNPNQDVFNVQQFYEKFGVPRHKFTGENYIELYQSICQEAGVECEILFCNNIKRIPDFIDCQNYLVCRIHDRERVASKLRDMGIENVLTLADIMNAPINGSGYNDRFGLLGSNDAKGKLKLMPINCQEFVDDVQDTILKEYGVHVEVLIFGDGAFKDPVGKIWELADPVVAPAYTSGLVGTPKEVKAKLFALDELSAEEIAQKIAEAREERKSNDDITNKNSLGTTPRQLSDLVGSLCDLTTGSGDRMTPVVLIRNYLV